MNRNSESLGSAGLEEYAAMTHLCLNQNRIEDISQISSLSNLRYEYTEALYQLAALGNPPCVPYPFCIMHSTSRPSKAYLICNIEQILHDAYESRDRHKSS